MQLALFEPDIAPNAGAMIRLAACLGATVDVIGPCGFVWSDARLRRAGMDYLALTEIRRHATWSAFRTARPAGRLVALTAAGDRSYVEFAFRADDTLLVGRESAGLPPAVLAAVEACLRVPMAGGARSLNVALAAAIVLGEALRQTGTLPATLARAS